MAGVDLAGEVQRKFGDAVQAAGFGVEAFVGVKVEVQAALAGEAEDPLQVGVEGWGCVGHDAQHAVRLRHRSAS